MSKKVKVFTHTDLDGIGSAILLKIAAHDSDFDLDYYYLDYDKVNDHISEFIKSGHHKNYDAIFITDISVNDEVAEMLNAIHEKQDQADVFLLDHHKTALDLNKYPWAKVQVEYPESYFNDGFKHKTSGTSLVMDYIKSTQSIFFTDENIFHVEGYDRDNLLDKMDEFAEIVRRYDTWEWYTFYQDDFPKLWNDLFYLQSRSEFADNMIDRIEYNQDILFTDVEQAILHQNQRSIDQYFDKKMNQVQYTEMQGFNCAYVFSEMYGSEIGNRMAIALPEADFIMLIDVGSMKVSLRGVKENVDLSQVAKYYGGGGHPRASGFTLEKSFLIDLLT